MNMVSNSTLQLAVKKLPLVEFWCNIKGDYPQLSSKAIQIHLSLSTTYLYEARFSSHTSTKHVAAGQMQKHVWEFICLLIKPDAKEICKNVKPNATLLAFFFFREYSYFSHKYVTYVNTLSGLSLFSNDLKINIFKFFEFCFPTQ